MSKKTRVLIADDHPMFRAGVASTLSSDPRFEVLGQARGGREAVELACTFSPDVVLLDLCMPDLSGVDAARAIAAQDLHQARIVILTVAEDAQSLMAALKGGAHAYVLKGVSGQELCDVVERAYNGEPYVTPTLAAEMLTEFVGTRAPQGVAVLSVREREVLELLVQGLSNRLIGEHLGLAEKTVKHYMTEILQKLHLKSRTEAALFAVRHGLH